MAKRGDRWCKDCTNQYRKDVRAGLVTVRRREGDNCLACGADLSGRPKNVIYCNETCRMQLFLEARPGFHTANWLSKAYGMTIEERDGLLAAQGGRCAICQRSEVEVWHVDHCHTTGAVRGILCPACNRGLGHFEDDARRLRAAVRYLVKSGGAKVGS